MSVENSLLHDTGNDRSIPADLAVDDRGLGGKGGATAKSRESASQSIRLLSDPAAVDDHVVILSKG